MATWPSSLRAPLIAGSSSGHSARTVVTPMETGPRRTTLLTKRWEGYGSYTLMLDKQQLSDFYDMYDDADHGTEWINDAPIDTGQGTAPHRIKISSVKYTQVVPDTTYSLQFEWETDETNSA